MSTRAAKEVTRHVRICSDVAMPLNNFIVLGIFKDVAFLNTTRLK